MTNKIVAIQGNHPKKLNPLTDTSAFLANEAQNKKYKIFYYEPKNLSIINDKVVAKGFFVKFDYTSKSFFKILKYQKLNLLNCKFILIRQDPPFNLEYISTTYILDKIKDKVKIINNPTSIRNISEKLYSSYYQRFMPKTIFTKDLKEIKNLDEKRLRKGHLTFQEAFWLCYELRDYVRNGNIPKGPYHIMSETQFNAEERKILHEHITDLRLYSGSSGSGKNRHIVVSHEFI